MKKIFFLCIIILFSTRVSFAMEYKLVSNITQTVYDKFDPSLVLAELNKNGVSKDPREKMTQMHRLDRLIPYYMDQRDTVSLCAALKQIVANKFPLSSIAYEMATDYLLQQRPAIIKDKPLLKDITLTLDLINPTQVIHDIQKEKVYDEDIGDFESRISQALSKLINLKDTNNLKKLIEILASADKIKYKNQKISIIPGERILKEVYQYLRTQEKETNVYKKTFLITFDKVKKNDSDTEEPKKNNEESTQ